MQVAHHQAVVGGAVLLAHVSAQLVGKRGVVGSDAAFLDRGFQRGADQRGVDHLLRVFPRYGRQAGKVRLRVQDLFGAESRELFENGCARVGLTTQKVGVEGLPRIGKSTHTNAICRG